jgi:hypothetical protein
MKILDLTLVTHLGFTSPVTALTPGFAHPATAIYNGNAVDPVSPAQYS